MTGSPIPDTPAPGSLVEQVLRDTGSTLRDVAADLVDQVGPMVPWWGWVLLATAVVLRVRRIATPWRRRDPVRLFEADQRAIGRARAGGRCEYAARFAPWRRCSAPAQESDHFYPWARGGATTLANLVAACSVHNQAKGGRPPSALTRWAIARRRRTYMPAGAATAPGAWYRRGSRLLARRAGR